MMPIPDIQKIEGLVEAARQRLALAHDQQAESWRKQSVLRARENTLAADELLAQAQQVLRTAS
jgi:hypothetical protein